MGGLGSDRLESGLKAAADKALHVLKAQQPVPKVLGGALKQESEAVRVSV